MSQIFFEGVFGFVRQKVSAQVQLLQFGKGFGFGKCQRPGIPHREIKCSKDFEVLEVVAPADFKTRIVDAPEGASEAAE